MPKGTKGKDMTLRVLQVFGKQLYIMAGMFVLPIEIILN